MSRLSVPIPSVAYNWDDRLNSDTFHPNDLSRISTSYGDPRSSIREDVEIGERLEQRSLSHSAELLLPLPTEPNNSILPIMPKAGRFWFIIFGIMLSDFLVSDLT